MGRWHAYYARRAGAEVVAVVDPSIDAARELAVQSGGAATFADAASMLASAGPDVVHVCSPLPTHVEVARRAIEAGAHVLVEKPLAPTAAETRALLDEARARGVHACPVHQFAFQRGVLLALAALRELGEPLHASFAVLSAGAAGRETHAQDAVVADILPHPLSVLQALWPAASLEPRQWTARRPRAGELHVSGLCGSATASAWISMNARPTRCDLEVACSEGSIRLDFFHGYAHVRRGSATRAEKIGQPFRLAAGTFARAAANLAGRAWRRELAYPGLEALVRAFHAAARGNGPPPVSPAQAIAVAEVREHLLREALPGVLAG